MGIHSWIFILTDIHCRMYLHGYPCSDINVDIVRLHDLLSLSPVNSVFFARSGRPFVIQSVLIGWGCSGLQMVNLSGRENGVWGRERGNRANTEYTLVCIIED